MEASVEGRGLVQGYGKAPAGLRARRRGGVRALPESLPSFHDRFVDLFDAHFQRLYRFMNRLSGEPELAADLVQEAFVKLYRRGSLPDAPEAWLISVAMNLFRNEKSTRSRRLKLLTPARSEGALSDPPPSPEEAVQGEDSRRSVRITLDRMPERERRMLLLRAEGYRYRDIAAALELNEASVGVLLARARRAFRKIYEDSFGAP
ncbi:MAG: sigma-70 family RNA polymerase sigma factor [Candidatus Eisenbacteria bacterium]|uniref:Sigma-70 family RNA polymerase sigma factor n=1 Tax=Eiseniibacteriota bacterium TaxID=2212470 RepID=A0A538T5E5_UNCEI|nr:MAG: sigma-70 family RNA polymerase sigma factor [Candidatus Eisenbacteria bacterium]